ncbi:MAG TPA: hypothetical protein VMR28_00080 [Candidatus Saccharimonadales bacterium]|nr:hypothetical protein [Candidatus Saccharimonadales bacterium]
MWYLLGVILWVIVAFWPAMVAKRKGHSFGLFFILSLIFFFLSLILAYVVSDRTMTAKDKADDRAAEKALDREENSI